MGLQDNLQNRTRRKMDHTIRIRPRFQRERTGVKYKLEE